MQRKIITITNLINNKMKTSKELTIKLYQFNELSEEAKKIAIENYRKTFDLYYIMDECVADVKSYIDKYVYDIEFEKADYLYGYVKFYKCGISVTELVKDLDDPVSSLCTERPLYERIKKLYDNVDKDIKRLFKFGLIENDTAIRYGNFTISCVDDLNVRINQSDREFPNIESVLDKVLRFEEKLIKQVEEYIGEFLQGCYEYYTSDEYITETLIEFEHLFTENGIDELEIKY